MLVLAMGFAAAAAPESSVLVSPTQWVEAPRSVDPDQPGLTLLTGMAPRAMAGGAVGVWGRRSERSAVSVGLSGFIELHSVDVEPGVQGFPWQAYRAHTGVDVRLRLSPREASTRWFLDLGIFHESDHAASTTVADAYDLVPEHFPNATLSTFEYVLVRPRVQVGQAVTAGLGARVFTPNVVWMDQSRRELGLTADLRLTGALGSATALWAGASTEVVLNGYDAPRPSDFRGGPFRTSMARAGLSLQGEQAVFEPLIDLRVGNGRGVDFALVHPVAINGGFSVWW